MLWVVMLLAQLGLAQHDAVHTALHFQISAQEHHHEDHQPGQPDDGCQVYLVAKCFSHALIGQLPALEPVRIVSLPVSYVTQARRNGYNPASYHPRGPPSVLI